MPIERFSLLIFPLCMIESGKRVETDSDVGMVRAEYLLTDREGTFGERFSLLIFALSKIEFSQIIQYGGSIKMIWTQRFFIYCQCCQEQLFGISRICTL